MKRLSKRSWALALALAMIISLFTGVSSNAASVGNDLYIADAHWSEENNQFELNDPPELRTETGMSVRNDQVFYLCWGNEEPKNNPLTEAEFNDSMLTYLGPDGEEEINVNDHIGPTGQEGYYNFRFEELGEYRLRLQAFEIIIYVNMPDLGVYDSEDSFEMENLISGNYVDNFVENENTYYIHSLNHGDPYADWIISSKINSITAWSEYFGRQYQIDEDDVKFEEVPGDKTTVKMTVSKDFTRNFYIIGDFERTRHEDGDSVAKDTWNDYRIDFSPQLEDYSGICANWSEREGFDNEGERQEFFRFRYTNFWEFPKILNATSGDDMFLSIAERTLENPEDYNSWTIAPVTDKSKLSVTKYDGSSVADDTYEIDNYTWTPEILDYVENEHSGDEDYIPGWSDKGVFRLRFKNPGKYKVCYDGEEESYFIVDVEARDCAMYSKNESGDYDFIAGPWEDYFYTPGETVYIMLSDQMKQIIKSDENLLSATINFKDELGLEPVDWLATDFEPLEVYVPASLSGNLYDSIWVTIRYDEMVERRDEQGNIIYDEDEKPEMVQKEDGWSFRLNGDDNGIVVAGTEGNWDNCSPKDPSKTNDFGKWWSGGAYNDHYVTLGLRDNDNSIELLDKDDLAKLSIIDEYGVELDPGEYTLEMATGENDEPYENIFKLGVKKLGRFGIVYNDNENESMFTYGSNIPEISVYGKNVISGEYLLGENVEYSPNRRKFYILADAWEDLDRENQEGSRREFTFKSAYIELESYWVEDPDEEEGGHWEEYDIDIDSIDITTDKNNGVTVSIPEKDKDGNDIVGSFRVKVNLNRLDEWYDDIYDEQGNYIRTDYRREYDTHMQRDFVFNSTDEALVYPPEVEKKIAAAQVVIDMIDALPDPSEVTVDDEEDIVAARDAFDNLKAEPKELVQAENYGKLLDDEDALETAKEKREEDIAAIEAVYEVINSLPDETPDADDYEDLSAYKEAVYNLESDVMGARVLYDILTDDQKDMFDEDVLFKLETLEEELEEVISDIKKAEIIDDYTADAALEKALDDLDNAIEKGEDFVDKYGESSYAKKDEIKAVTDLNDDLDELYDELDDLSQNPDATNEEKLEKAKEAENLIKQQEAAIKTATDTILKAIDEFESLKSFVMGMLISDYLKFDQNDYAEADYNEIKNQYNLAVAGIKNATTRDGVVEYYSAFLEETYKVKTLAQKEEDQEANDNVKTAREVAGGKLDEKTTILAELGENEFVTENDIADVSNAFDDLSAALEALNGLGENATNDEKNLAAKLVEQAVDKVNDEIKEAKDNAEKAENEDVAQKVASQIAELKAIEDITPADRESIDAARAAYDALTPEQKALIDADVVTKLNNSEAAVLAAEEVEKTKKEDAEKASKDADEAAKKAEADKQAAVEKAKKETEEAVKNVPPVAGTVIYDAKSKAIYKVLIPSAKGKVGTVEYKRPEGSPKKANIPETITVNNFKYDVTAIGAGAFEDCAKLKSVTVPSKVTIIGARAFAGCGKLKLIKVKSTVLKKVGAKALNKINKKAKIKVPKAQKKAYKKLFKKKGQPKSVKIK